FCAQLYGVANSRVVCPYPYRPTQCQWGGDGLLLRRWGPSGLSAERRDGGGRFYGGRRDWPPRPAARRERPRQRARGHPPRRDLCQRPHHDEPWRRNSWTDSQGGAQGVKSREGAGGTSSGGGIGVRVGFSALPHRPHGAPVQRNVPLSLWRYTSV